MSATEQHALLLHTELYAWSLFLHPVTDLLLEELALNPSGSGSVTENRNKNTVDEKVRKKSHLRETDFLQTCCENAEWVYWRLINLLQLKQAEHKLKSLMWKMKICQIIAKR